VFSLAKLKQVRLIRKRSWETFTESEKQLVQQAERAILARDSIALTPQIKGVFLAENGMGASTPAALSITWQQDGQVYSVGHRTRLMDNGQAFPEDKEKLIATAKSMANGELIYDRATSAKKRKATQSQQTLQQLPDGTYLYAEDPQGFHRGTNAFKFRKKGNLISGEYFTSMEPNDCFVARVSGQSIEGGMWLDLTPTGRETPHLPSFSNRTIDFRNYYKVTSRDLESVSSDSFRAYLSSERVTCEGHFKDLERGFLEASAPAAANLPQNSKDKALKPSPRVTSNSTIASARPPGAQEVSQLIQQSRNLKSIAKLSQSQLSDRQTLRKQSNKYLAPFAGGWLTADNQRLFVYPSTRRERQACIIVEKDGTQDLQIGIASGNATGMDINIGDLRLFNTKQETLALRRPGSDQLIAVYPSADSANLTADHRSAMEGNSCITSFPSTSIATAPTKPAFQSSKTFNSIKTFGLEQFVRGDQELAKVPPDLEKAKQGQYALPKLPELDLLTEKLTDVPEKSGAFLGSRKDITLKDYLTLKLKVHQQGLLLGRTAQALGTAEKYLDQFPKDGQNRLPLVNNISAQFWQAVDQDSGSKWGLGDRLVYAIEEGRVSTGDFIKGTASTGFAAFTAWRSLGEWIDLLPNGSKKRLQGLDTMVDAQEYLSSVDSYLSGILEASKSGDLDKANRELANLATATVKWVDALPENKGQSKKVLGRGKLLLEIRSNALKLKDATDLLKAPSTKEALDGFDRVYLTAASIDSAVELVSTVISALAPEKSGTSTLFGKAKAFKIIVIDSIKFTYQDDIRRQYQALQGQDKVNQKKINGLSAAFDFSGEEIGKYLLKNRTDVLRQNQNGVVEVSTKETVYPRN
jgi:hypothetical protein